ncbi:MAG: hypothetical protein CVV39_01335 [Planctomycetes bacterium HGW-Planctomycetes-1]|nr:MAG: hypothetical protein CVV39_01335 [Planctomycetes bacterium HGW-Planctomycetes-1]
MYFTDLLSGIKLFGASFFIKAATYRLKGRIGLLEQRTPKNHWHKLDLNSFIKPNFKKENIKDELLHTKFFPVREIIGHPDVLRRTNSKSLETIKTANDILEGKFKYFSKEQYYFGQSINWHQNPVTKECYPIGKHWSKIEIYSKNIGDIKLVWELSRFSWIYDLVRAFALTGNSKYSEKFWLLIEDWLQNNQPNTGVNWMSGQECALRLMACCFGLFSFLEDEQTTPQRIEKLLLAFVLHAERIETFISHAIRQRTNHAMTEATGLYTVGTLFPFFDKAEKWKKLGKKILEQEGLVQIYEDGSYVQQSMNYHRVMLHSYLWSFRLAQIYDDNFSESLRSRVCKAAEFIYQVQDEQAGRVPNYGANDGALILPLNSCDYLDYRPIVQSMNYLLTKERVFDSGDWDEDMLWLFGREAVDFKKQAACYRSSTGFSTGNYYTMRCKDSWAMLRCHSYNWRIGHEDMLNLDLWADGVNLLRDCGSYKYFAIDEPELKKYFSSINAHNTIVIDNSSPFRTIFSGIKVPPPRAEILLFEVEANILKFKGINFAYKRKPWQVEHIREIEANIKEDKWQIIDKISGRGGHLCRLQWHLPAEAEIINRDENFVRLQLANGWKLKIESENQIKAELLKADKNGGWESLYYNYKQPICTIHIICRFQSDCLFNTTLSKDT